MMNDWVSTILPKLHTGDVILTSYPRGNFGTNINRCMSHSRSSHIGIVYRPSDCPSILKHRDRVFPTKVDTSRPLLLQMLGSGTVGHREQQSKDQFRHGGLDLVDLETYLRDYLDKFSYSEHPLEMETVIVGARMLTDFDRNHDFYQQVEDVVDCNWDKPFQNDAGNVKIQIDCCQTACFFCPSCISCCKAKDDAKALICSELAARVYIKTGLMKKGICGYDLNSGEMVPVHWDTSRKLRLVNGVHLSKEYIAMGPSSLEERTSMGYQKLQSDPTPTSVAHGAGGWWGVNTEHGVPEQTYAPEQMSMGSHSHQDLRKVACEPEQPGNADELH